MTFFLMSLDDASGLALLEKKFQAWRQENPERFSELEAIAREAARVQTEMRGLLDDAVFELCPRCDSPCCMILPVEGWFTPADYFIYRALNDAPFDLLVDGGAPGACRFLGPRGCVLPGGSRPFPCVKVNCEALKVVLQRSGRSGDFEKLSERLDALQRRMWPLLRGSTSEFSGKE